MVHIKSEAVNEDPMARFLENISEMTRILKASLSDLYLCLHFILSHFVE